jgi:predicted permease
VRLALGASPADLARAVLVDGLVLAALGGVAAVFVAAWSSESIRALLLPDLAGAERFLSWRLIAIAAAGTLSAGVLAGLVPALRATGASPVEDLKGGGLRGRLRTRAPAMLLVAQSGLCMVLLVAASLFVLSLHRVRTQDFGFRSAGVLLATLRFDGPRDGPAQDAVYQEAERAVSRLPGVELASIVQAVPFSGHNVPPIAVPGREDFPDMRQQAPFMVATTPTYFRVLGMRLLEGRAFTAADRAGAPLVLIVNQAMAQGVWPGESAIGKCVRVGFVPGELPTGLHASPTLPCRFVVGVVNNARPRSIREESGQARMQYYVPFGQLPPPFFAAAAPQIQGLLVRTVDGAALARPVQRMLQSFTSGVQLADVRPLQDLLDRQMRPWLLGAALFSVFGILALGLAGVGVYGVRAHSVTQRTQEIGIRMSLGAGADAVVRMVLWEGLRVTLIGIALGIGVALAMGRMIEPLLFQTRARDPAAFAAIGMTLLLVAVAASALPAWRAARVDPNVALRAE